MKRTILTLAAIVTLASCQKSDIERMNEMRAPVIVSAKASGIDDVVLLVDADGHVEEFVGLVFENCKVGDTIVPSPWKPFKQRAVMNKYAEKTATHP